jgi:hypothetical protein
MSAADRSRAYRARLRQGHRIARIEIDIDRVRSALIAAGRIPDALDDDPVAEDAALERLIRAWCLTIEKKRVSGA